MLIHTFDRYRHYWGGWVKGYLSNEVNYSGGEYMIYWGTDIQPQTKDRNTIGRILLSGEGEWSDRLINLLHQIPTNYVFYIQEDMWPCAKHPNLDELLKIMVDNGLYRLQISPIVQFYSLTGTNPIYFHWKSKYLVSHQPSIWKKDFLLSCLKPNEDPWKNEYEGTKRLNNEKITGKIAIYPHYWFTHESVNMKK